MGAQNVALVFAQWRTLNHAPHRALTYMALRSLDAGNPPIYYGGRDELAVALGRPMATPGPDFEKQRKANWETVKKVIAELTRAGAIRLTSIPGPGNNSVYQLLIHPSYPQGDGGMPVPPSGGNSVPERWEVSSPNGGKPVPPLGTRRSIRSTEGGDGGGDHQPAGFAREPEPEKADNSISNSSDHSAPSCNCGAVLDPDGSCFICRTAPKKGMYA